MDITFSSPKLEKACNSDKEIRKKFGERQGAKLKQRLGELRAASTLEELRNVPGNYHELREDRKGQLAVYLVHPYRLVFVPANNPIPTKPDGGLDWNRVTAINVVEIIDYH